MRKGLSIAAVVVLVLLAPAAAVPSYDFPGRRPFSGATWRNPYARWSGQPLKVNLHAHSRAWLGLTAGTGSPEELAQAYASWGFDALAITNYHQVTRLEAPPLAMVRGYEHGLNWSKSHRLVLGTDAVAGFDFPMPTRSGLQWVLDSIAPGGGLVGINHPALRQGHSCADLEALTGYQFVEVHNAYAMSHFEWDCALSAGRLAWALGDDDSHSPREEGIGIAWNMIDARTRDEAGILAALRDGASYAVRGERGRMDVGLQRLEVFPAGMVVQLTGAASRVEWYTDGGTLRHVDTDVAISAFTPHPDDHYVRVIVRTPRTELVLNPVVRWGGWSPPKATIDWPKTFAGWAAWLVGALAVAFSWPRRPALRLVEPVRRAA